MAATTTDPKWICIQSKQSENENISINSLINLIKYKNNYSAVLSFLAFLSSNSTVIIGFPSSSTSKIHLAFLSVLSPKNRLIADGTVVLNEPLFSCIFVLYIIFKPFINLCKVIPVLIYVIFPYINLTLFSTDFP